MRDKTPKHNFISNYNTAFLIFDKVKVFSGPLKVVKLFEAQAKGVLSILKSLAFSLSSTSVKQRAVKRDNPLVTRVEEILDQFLFSFLIRGKFYSRDPGSWKSNLLAIYQLEDLEIVYTQTGWRNPLIFEIAGTVFKFESIKANQGTNIRLVDILKGKKGSDFDFKFIFQSVDGLVSGGIPDFRSFNLLSKDKQFLLDYKDLLEQFCLNYVWMQRQDFFVISNVDKILNFSLARNILKIFEDDFPVSAISSLRLGLKAILGLITSIEKAFYSCWSKTPSCRQIEAIVSLKTLASVCSSDEKQSLAQQLKSNSQWISFLRDCGLEIASNECDFWELSIPLCTEFFDSQVKSFIDQKLSKERKEDLGLIIFSDNWQALQFLIAEGFAEKVDVIYLDPPYNTKTKVFAYNDSFDSYAYTSLLSTRLKLAKKLLREDGVIFISIDDKELDTLMGVVKRHFPRFFLVKVRMRNPNRQLAQYAMFQKSIEFLLICSKQKKVKLNRPTVPYDFSEYKYKVFLQKKPIKTFEIGGHLVEMYSPDCYKLIKIRQGNANALKLISIRGKIKEFAGKFYETYLKPLFKESKNFDYLFKVYGIGDDGLGFRYFKHPSPNTINGVYLQGVPLNVQLSSKKEKSISLSDFWDFESAMNLESKQLRNMGLGFFKSIKPIDFLKYILSLHKNPQIVLDFFAGSGSLAHAALSLRANSKTRIKFVVVDNNPESIDFTKKRVIKLFQSFNWKKEKPLDQNGVSGFIKVLTLESFEDKLLNFQLDQSW